MIDTDRNQEHSVTYDQTTTCCTSEEKNNAQVDLKNTGPKGHSHEQSGGASNIWKLFGPSIISFLLLLVGISFDHFFNVVFFTGWVRICWYLLAYAFVGFPVLREAFESIRKGDVFSEFLLMGIATIGAFAIGEYPEGVAVMLFYSVGEVFQHLAVSRAKKSIKSLLDQRPEEVTVIRDSGAEIVKAEGVVINEVVELKPGEKLALDGELLSDRASFNTSALTGESKPDTKTKGEQVLAGMINLNTVAQVKVTTVFTDSKLSKILELVQNATSQKAPTELFIRKFAKIYTPIVVFLAIAICFLPILFVADYVFQEWLYRALVFLVISCPCALVISIPLGYFGGVGAASRHGILVKGSNFLDALANVQHVVMDKTGTMTEGVFKVKEEVFREESNQVELLQLVNRLESYSSHPIATAIHEFAGVVNQEILLQNVEEIPGQGLRAEAEGKLLLVGNFQLMDAYSISYDTNPENIVDTVIAIAYDNIYQGYLTISDRIKDDAQITIEKLKALDIKVTMLSGDKNAVVKFVADKLGIKNAFGDLLPEGKVEKIKEIKRKKGLVAFVGDGVNDAPVVALSDIGIAMGGLGSDATIETADVVIQDDKPSKIPMAIKIGKQTKNIVWQNITLAIVVKGVVLILGAGGLATMWEAVFADVGVALLAILNAIRIQRMNF